MGVAVLNPRDCLKAPPFPHQFPLRTPKTSANSNFNSNPNAKTNISAHRGRRRNPRESSRSSFPRSKHTPIMGQVKILKRGEDLPKMKPFLGSVQSSGTETGPKIDQAQSETVMKRSGSAGDVTGFYAGSAFFVSPPPSSVPLPAFFTKKVEVPKYDDATTDLRRILGIA